MFQRTTNYARRLSGTGTALSVPGFDSEISCTAARNVIAIDHCDHTPPEQKGSQKVVVTCVRGNEFVISSRRLRWEHVITAVPSRPIPTAAAAEMTRQRRSRRSATIGDRRSSESCRGPVASNNDGPDKRTFHRAVGRSFG